MATPGRGKTIVENLVEYPLPKKQGVRDYVFYCFPTEDDSTACSAPRRVPQPR